MSEGGEQVNDDGVELVPCPECGNVASIKWGSWIGELLHLKFRCVNRHWFLMPAERITFYGTDASDLSTQVFGA